MVEVEDNAPGLHDGEDHEEDHKEDDAEKNENLTAD